MWTPPPHTHTHSHSHTTNIISPLLISLLWREETVFTHTALASRRGGLAVESFAPRHTQRFCDTQSLFAVNNYCARNISVTDKHTVNTNTQRKTHENTVFHRNTKTIYPTLLGSRTVFISNSVKHHGGEIHRFLFFLFLKAGFGLQHSGATDTGSCSEFNQSRKRVHSDRDSDA